MCGINDGVGGGLREGANGVNGVNCRVMVLILNGKSSPRLLFPLDGCAS